MSPRNVCAALAVLLAAAGCERAGIGEAPASSQHA
ncbi:MAG: hypothetical protein FD160_3899, partial [Caulobacteraceae bacterium]